NLKPNWVRTRTRTRRNEDTEDENDQRVFIVVNFYKFLFIKDPENEVNKHLEFLEGHNIHGRIYINEQGINAQISPPTSRHVFPRLKLRYKPSLVQLEGGVSHLPLTDSSMRATPLTPTEWKKKLEAANSIDVASHSNQNKDVILLDVRNGYEWDIGHFCGAQRPNVDCFRSTTFGLSESE
nr:hypothetical protein [Tanacetum cinerariifolium]